MVPSEDKKGLGHKPRQNVTIRDLAGVGSDEVVKASIVEQLRQHPEFSYLRKWGVRLDEHNSRVWPILKRLYRVWPRFKPEDRAFYLSTAESIAAAEKAKDEWNPKAVRSRCSQVTRNVAAAAKLAKELNAIFPPVWSNDAAPIGNLIEGLVSFGCGYFGTTVQAGYRRRWS